MSIKGNDMEQRTWRQRRQDSFQLGQLTDAWLALKVEKENCVWQRHHETAWVTTAQNRYEVARAGWEKAVESWLSYCRQARAAGNVVYIYHP